MLYVKIMLQNITIINMSMFLFKIYADILENIINYDMM